MRTHRAVVTYWRTHNNESSSSSFIDNCNCVQWANKLHPMWIIYYDLCCCCGMSPNNNYQDNMSPISLLKRRGHCSKTHLYSLSPSKYILSLTPLLLFSVRAAVAVQFQLSPLCNTMYSQSSSQSFIAPSYNHNDRHHCIARSSSSSEWRRRQQRETLHSILYRGLHRSTVGRSVVLRSGAAAAGGVTQSPQRRRRRPMHMRGKFVIVLMAEELYYNP